MASGIMRFRTEMAVRELVESEILECRWDANWYFAKARVPQWTILKQRIDNRQGFRVADWLRKLPESGQSFPG